METNTFVVRGKTAELRWGYQQAAVLGAWQITGDQTIEASIVSADDLRVSQRPLMFVTQSPNGHTWTWPVASLQIDGSRLTGTVGTSEG